MDKENKEKVLISHKEVWNYVICRKMDATEDHHVK
jgi:hypothetical protein